jgi:hypothetical protein
MIGRIEFVQFRYLTAEMTAAFYQMNGLARIREIQGSRNARHATTYNQHGISSSLLNMFKTSH